ncbi:MAG: bis(5'-nucleosyl)-tetraphosphatase (symmetrical) YqeK [Dehalococcoidia bacterium]|nr:bis(5'-nucleosyl)-tetraphosphatase (symmetrical) YqeK [Dehalococcoidia bacterium]
MSYGTAEAIARRVRSLPQGLQRHIQRVQDVAAKLAGVHDADEERVRLGAMAHDVARAMNGDELLAHARDMGIPVHPVEAAVPVLLHGPVGAELLRRLHGLEDREVYEAVYWHSTAHKDLGVLGKIVFLADKLDPHKKARYPFIDRVERLAAKSLDRAVAEFLSRELVDLIGQGSLVHPASVEARNRLLLKHG